MGVQGNDSKPTDDQVCAALAGGDISAMAAVYEAYSDRLFGYALGVTRNRELAADAVSDTLLLAYARFHQLRDHARLRPWLYAICRNECLRALRAGNRTAALDSAGEVADMSTDLDAGIAADDARQLIDSAFEGMNQGDRELIDLALRQDLSPTQIGEVIGVSANNASARLSTAKVQLERAVGALLLLRTRGSSCAELRKIVDGQSFSPLLRKRIARHCDSCDECSATRKRAVAAIALVSLPVIAAPAWLRGAFYAGQPSTVAFISPLSAPGAPGAPGTAAGPAASSSAGPGADAATGIGGGSVGAGGAGGAGATAQPVMDLAAMQRRSRLLDQERAPFDSNGWPQAITAVRRWPVALAAIGAFLIVIGIVLGWLTMARPGPAVGGESSAGAVVATGTPTGTATGTATGPTPTASRTRSTRPTSPSSTRSSSPDYPTSTSGTPRPTRSSSSPQPSKSSSSPSGSSSSPGKTTSPPGPNDPGYQPTYPVVTIPPQPPVPLR